MAAEGVDNLATKDSDSFGSISFTSRATFVMKTGTEMRGGWPGLHIAPSTTIECHAGAKWKWSNSKSKWIVDFTVQVMRQFTLGVNSRKHNAEWTGKADMRKTTILENRLSKPSWGPIFTYPPPPGGGENLYPGRKRENLFPPGGKKITFTPGRKRDSGVNHFDSTVTAWFVFVVSWAYEILPIFLSRSRAACLPKLTAPPSEHVNGLELSVQRP